jgi:hypothetical protein
MQATDVGNGFKNAFTPRGVGRSVPASAAEAERTLRREREGLPNDRTG